MKIKKDIFTNDNTADAGIRINKYLADAGVCSRREGDQAIEQGLVTIDGEPAQMGSRVKPGQRVTYRGRDISKVDDLILIAFNKPIGIVCTTDRRDPDNIIDFISYPKRIFPIGRLDKDSEGLILLTNDGDIVNKILRAGNYHEKEYIVRVNKPITPEFIKAMGSGVPILDTVTRPCFVEQIDNFSFRIILTQGLNRQIRRMCEALEYRVRALTRVRIMNINLGRLKTGTYRNLLPEEIDKLRELIAASSNAPVAGEDTHSGVERSYSTKATEQRDHSRRASDQRDHSRRAAEHTDSKYFNKKDDHHGTAGKDQQTKRTDSTPFRGRKNVRAGRPGDNK